MEDEHIVRLYWERSQEALALTQEKYGALVHHIASSILSDPRDAEEAISDTYIRLWNSIPPNRPRNFCAYAMKLCRNAALDILRTKHREKRDSRCEVLFSELDGCLPAPANLAEELEARELAALMNRYLYTLDVTSRSLFIRRYFAMEELDVLSRHFHMKKHTISARLYRIRKGLRVFLEKEGIHL